MKDLEGMKIIVTGGAGSIGHATACVLAAKGADILLVDINREGLEVRRAAVAKFGTQVETFHADVSRSEAVQGYVAAASKAFGRIDGLFNNAGTEGKVASIENYDEVEFDRLMAVNLRSIFLGLRYVIPVMLGQGVKPQHWDPLADALPLSELQAQSANLRTRLQQGIGE